MKKIASMLFGLLLVLGFTTTLSAAEKCGAGKCGDTKTEKPQKCGAGKCGDSK
ncbi:hypothetical protein [Helicobacter sp. 16-1353]|uniref:HvfA family oxazolone/thioamide-modified RiPP metallophore n=1 Tax=Helicobacter sp. 16-1353 TaxID=2004996 RepID=UPI0015EF448E|nr:hypothetical protein [Helicobacter sp. 16-1353]